MEYIIVCDTGTPCYRIAARTQLGLATLLTSRLDSRPWIESSARQNLLSRWDRRQFQRQPRSTIYPALYRHHFIHLPQLEVTSASFLGLELRLMITRSLSLVQPAGTACRRHWSRRYCVLLNTVNSSGRDWKQFCWSWRMREPASALVVMAFLQVCADISCTLHYNGMYVSRLYCSDQLLLNKIFTILGQPESMLSPWAHWEIKMRPDFTVTTHFFYTFCILNPCILRSML